MTDLKILLAKHASGLNLATVIGVNLMTDQAKRVVETMIAEDLMVAVILISTAYASDRFAEIELCCGGCFDTF